jgi:ATP-binding cassette subfamily F protein 3
MLQLENVAKVFGSQTLFENITMQVSPTSRIGLVGRNGVGKSTLFKLMMGEIQPDAGHIHRDPGIIIQCLTQEPKITHGNTLLEEVMSAFPSLQSLEEEETNLLARWDELSTDEQMSACDRLAAINHAKEQMGHLEADVSRMLTGLGFSLGSFTRKVEHFSGGWQMRINLAKVLLQGAHFILMDEPTNHLDLEAREWLEGFLKTYPGGLLVVSHDRQFLDAVVSEIAEIELGHLTIWPGNYTQAKQLKAEQHERLQAAADRQKKDLAKQMEFVERFRASATKSTQAKSREKQLAKIERIEPPKTDNQKIHIRFPSPPSSAREVLTFSDVGKSFYKSENATSNHEHDLHLFSGMNAQIERGHHVFLLGANGCGKTTLLRMVLGLEPLTEGKIEPGAQVKIGYFSQHQLETLDPALTVLETMQHEASEKIPITEIRALLGRFLFSGDRVSKPVHVLSGGEKSRLALAKLILGADNMLLLDEPTNHMDIHAQTAIEMAFKEYEGALLCISHDRYFIQQVATHIWEFYRGQLIKYDGSYDFYVSKRDEKRAVVDAQIAKRQKKLAGASKH